MLTVKKRHSAKQKTASVKRRIAAAATKTVSTRVPTAMLVEASSLRPDAKISAMMLEALDEWIHHRRRQKEDEMIARALASVSPRQREEELELAGLASRSASRTMEKTHG